MIRWKQRMRVKIDVFVPALIDLRSFFLLSSRWTVYSSGMKLWSGHPFLLVSRPATRNVSPGILMNAAENKTDILSHLGEYNNQPRLSRPFCRCKISKRNWNGWRPRFLERVGTTLNLRYLSRFLGDCTVTQVQRYNVIIIIELFENNNGHFERVNLLWGGESCFEYLSYKYNCCVRSELHT